MKKVGILYQPKLAEAQALAQDLLRALPNMGASPWISSAWDEREAKGHLDGTELVLSLGGDGTLLRAARMVVPLPIPILGVNQGRLGFLSELSPEEVHDRLPAFLEGKGWLDERLMLQAEVETIPPGRRLESLEGAAAPPEGLLHALNDVVVGRGAICRVVHIKTLIEGDLLITYKADGVLVSTPTGSTGYSLALGGPILHPQMESLLLKPISAHLSLSNALLVPATASIELEVMTDHEAMLSIDGQLDFPLQSGERVRIRRSPYRARLIRSRPPHTFYSTLMERLRWGMSPP